LSVRDETIAENALAKSQTAEEEAQANAWVTS
jgi:hypothetical protein